MSSGLNYLWQIIRGKSPRDVIASMSEEDFDKVLAAAGKIKGNVHLTRQQRRQVERQLRAARK